MIAQRAGAGVRQYGRVGAERGPAAAAELLKLMKLAGRYRAPRAGSLYTPTAPQTSAALLPTGTAGLPVEALVRFTVPSPETNVMGMPERDRPQAAGLPSFERLAEDAV